jgi:hypothetical protein
MNNSNINSPQTKTPRHVQAALKKQGAVVALRQLIERQRIEAREQLLQLTREAAAETARARKIDREDFRVQEGRFAARLGRMVLNAMRVQGIEGVLLEAGAVETLWSPEERDALALFLKPKESDFGIQLDDASHQTTPVNDAADPTIESPGSPTEMHGRQEIS